ncbi:MAG: vanadium-dependent haloperoxidase [Bacteroidota bacterium]|nr:vanadium-dependent haloperoxidase [Bacteroidota bacterium]
MRYALVAIALYAIAVTGCNRPSDYQAIFNNPLLYSKTVYQLNTVVMGNNFSPIVASRNYTYANIAAYQVVAGGYPDKYESLGGQLNGLKMTPGPEKGKPVDVEFAALLAFCKLGEAVTFPAGSMKDYVDSLKKLATDHGMPTDMFNNSIAYADTVSAVIMNWSKGDNYLQTRGASEYTVIDTPGRWVPTPPAYSAAAEPHWREIRPMVMDSFSMFPAPQPYTFNIKDKNSDYYKEVIAIKNAGDSLTPEQAHIADFWDDNPFKLNVSGHLMFGTKKFSPPGHWMSIVGIAAKKANADFPTTVSAFTITAIALFDAFIQCWDAKYQFNTVRPETVINKYIDPNWRPHLQTPPFPEYTCGHSTGSAAAAEALTSVFGDNFSYTDTTELEFGIANRSYKSFREAAMENNWARFYGGIHYHYSCLRSTVLGNKVGDLVAQRLKMKKS